MKKFFITFSMSTLLLLQLFFLYFIKYSTLQLPLSHFTFLTIGNFINLFSTLLLVTGFIVFVYSGTKKESEQFLYSFTIILIFLLSLAAFSTQIKIPFNDVYLLTQTLDKIIIAALFAFYQFFLFYFGMFLWMKIIGRKELVAVYSLFNTGVISIIIIIIGFIYVSTFTQAKINLSEGQNKKHRIGVVLGAAVWSDNQPSPSLKARVDKAIQLFSDKKIDLIQLTGSNAPGELSEADVAFDYITENGINPKFIWKENRTTSTLEQIKFIRSEILTRKDVEEITIISDTYHLPRVMEIANFFKLKVNVVASDIEFKFESKAQNQIRETIAIIIFWLFGL
ncbi:MAG TPA: YdcF family protein [Ignavibacteriaceae bacterium]|nr:YdcF family protein [Ignavibacteriaceae bacterium]